MQWWRLFFFMTLFETLRIDLRALDGDLYLSHLFAPAARREALLTMFYAYADIARIPFSSSEPHLQAIRFQWWRDLLEALEGGETLGAPIGKALQIHKPHKAALLTMVAAREKFNAQQANAQQAALVGPAFLRLCLGALEIHNFADELIDNAGQGFEQMRLTQPDNPASAQTAKVLLERAQKNYNKLPRQQRRAALAAFMPVGLMAHRAYHYGYEKSLLRYQLALLWMNFRAHI